MEVLVLVALAVAAFIGGVFAFRKARETFETENEITDPEIISFEERQERRERLRESLRQEVERREIEASRTDRAEPNPTSEDVAQVRSRLDRLREDL